MYVLLGFTMWAGYVAVKYEIFGRCSLVFGTGLDLNLTLRVISQSILWIDQVVLEGGVKRRNG
jgi:hypothetical protein